MMLRVWGLSCLVVALCASAARADNAQFVLIDAIFTAAANNTMSSEYAVAPLEGAPANWRSPIDYASGKIHVRVQVLEKPSDMKTLCNVCFKESDTLTCMPYPEPYTRPGVYESEPKISSFWQYDVYDWTKRVERVNVVVKDENGRFVQGNPAFFPTKLHVTVTVIPPGERFVDRDPVSGDDSDAGMGMLPGEPAPPATAARNPNMTGSAGVTAAPPVRPLTGTMMPAVGGMVAASTVVAPATTPPAPTTGAAGMHRDIRDFVSPGSSCAVLHACPKARYGGTVSVAFTALCLWQIARIRRRKFHHVRRVRSHGRRA
jgi:hypothetical protein